MKTHHTEVARPLPKSRSEVGLNSGSICEICNTKKYILLYNYNFRIERLSEASKMDMKRAKRNMKPLKSSLNTCK